MSRELREKADLVMRELREYLAPISDELHRMKGEDRKIRDTGRDY